MYAEMEMRDDPLRFPEIGVGMDETLKILDRGSWNLQKGLKLPSAEMLLAQCTFRICHRRTWLAQKYALGHGWSFLESVLNDGRGPKSNAKDITGFLLQIYTLDNFVIPHFFLGLSMLLYTCLQSEQLPSSGMITDLLHRTNALAQSIEVESKNAGRLT